MTVRPDPHEVKQLVTRTFLDLGAFSPRLLDLKETIFVNGGGPQSRVVRGGRNRGVL
jgi:hypothetical protein